MDRYLLFGGLFDRPHGGWFDLLSSHSSEKEALDAATAARVPRTSATWDWWHIVDGETGKIIMCHPVPILGTEQACSVRSER